MSPRMIRNIIIVLLLNAAILVAVNYFHHEPVPNLKTEELKIKYAIKDSSSVDHSKFLQLQKKFNSPQEVTEACLSCHNGTAAEVMSSSHWNWQRVSYIDGRGIKFIGKRDILNNFCIGAESNEKACSKCHIGYGMSDNHFDFNNQRNVDCMVCHDNSNEYIKGSSTAGYPDRSVNLTKVAESVGRPSKINCGACHFNGGGGNNVKHGDLEEGILTCTRDEDVHMTSAGIDLDCVSCHKTKHHDISGRLYSVSSNNVDRVTCEQCHTNTPHLDDLLNKHAAKVSCQACHIPEYAKINATKMHWKWSDAGKLKNGEPYAVEDSMGNDSYLSIKGSFVWEKNVVPDYVWFNGNAKHYLLGDKIDPTRPVVLNPLEGSYSDKDSKIIPVKIFTGDQIYDKVNDVLIQPKLYGTQKGDSAYWEDFNWGTAAAAGMKRIGLPFSGKYGFVNTVMYWPVNHMVAPKEDALQCAACHTRDNGRLAKLTGFYLPGRDHNAILDKLGGALLVIALLGVLIHAAARFVANNIKLDKPQEISGETI